MASDYYLGASDPSATLLRDNFLVPGLTNYSTLTESDLPLVDYLNAQLSAARVAGAPSAYVFLRNSPDSATNYQFYQLGMNEAGGANIPTLAYTTLTIPVWSQVPIGGGGFVTGIVGDSTGADIYARTDVGGLFKWNASPGNWSNLTDTLGSTTARWNTTDGLLATMSIAIDPSAPANLYIAVGGGSVSDTKAGIYSSPDRGDNWIEITSGTPNFSINGNADRAGGERLAVDPNNSNILWYGSESSGLMKGVKGTSGWTWSQVPGTQVPFGTVEPDTNPKGVRFVVCDKNAGNTITYAGVYDYSGSTGGVYKTTNGTDWTKVTGITLAKPSRAAVATDGTLFVTGLGGVVKMTRAGAVTTITPGSATTDYRGLAISLDGTVVGVANVNAGTCQIWRSTGGGAAGTWKTQNTNYFNNQDHSASRIYAKEPDGTLSHNYPWLGNVAALWINPANTNELWASDFYGVQRTQEADRIGNTAVNTQPTWYRLLKNLDETLIFAVRNAPTGARAITGVADVGGFRHATDLTQRPFASGNGGAHNATRYRNITSLDFCESAPSTWAYAWAHTEYSGTGAVSIDGGVNWMRFGQIARRSITNSTTPGWEVFDLGAYLSKQREKGVTNITLAIAGADKWWENTPSLSFESKDGTSGYAPRLVVNGGPEILANADTYVYKANTTTKATNYGTSPSLLVRGNMGFDAWSYVRFDLSAYTTISSAQLKIYRLLSSTNTQTLEVTVNACAPNVSWSESTMTYDTNRVYPLVDALNGDPLTQEPRYRVGGRELRGGRIAISATDQNKMVWLPIVTVSPADPNPPSAYYSEDRGVTWTSSTGAPSSQIYGLYTDGTRLGSTGQNLTADRVNGDFYIAHFNAWDPTTSTGRHVTYRSSDGGKTWNSVGSANHGGSANSRTAQIVAAPVSPLYPNGGDLWLCDDSTYNNNPSGGGLWRSTDGGQNWTKTTTIGRVSHVSFGKSSSGTGYAVYVHGEATAANGGLRKVYRSDDYGISAWTALGTLPSSIPILSLAGDRQTYNSVFLGTNGRGLFHYKQ